MNANQAVEIVLPNVLGFERIAMACSAAFAQLQGLPPDRIEDLKTVVAEAATNAMLHGNGGRAKAHVAIRLERMPDAITVTVTDEGRGFENTIRDPDIERIMNDQEEPVGFGLFLIRNLADEVTYTVSQGGGHRVAMRIAWQR